MITFQTNVLNLAKTKTQNLNQQTKSHHTEQNVIKTQ